MEDDLHLGIAEHSGERLEARDCEGVDDDRLQSGR
jgi:hypothetical protein